MKSSRAGSLRALAGLSNPATSVGEAKALAKDLGLATLQGTGVNGVSIFRITASLETTKLRKQLNSLGFKYTAQEVSKKIDRRFAKVLNTMTLGALDATKASCPVHYDEIHGRSGVLRDQHIHATGEPYEGPGTGRFQSGSLVTMSRDVYIDNDLHIVDYRKKNLRASSLADFKNSVSQNRTAPGEASSDSGVIFAGALKSSPSLNWIGQAQQNYNKNRKLLISKAIGV